MPFRQDASRIESVPEITNRVCNRHNVPNQEPSAEELNYALRAIGVNDLPWTFEEMAVLDKSQPAPLYRSAEELLKHNRDKLRHTTPYFAQEAETLTKCRKVHELARVEEAMMWDSRAKWMLGVNALAWRNEKGCYVSTGRLTQVYRADRFEDAWILATGQVWPEGGAK